MTFAARHHRVLWGALLLVRVGLAAVFVVAGVLKLRDPAKFALEIGNYQLIPAGLAVLAPALAVVLPALEIVAGAAVLVLPARWRQSAAVLLAGLSGAFTLAVASALLRKVNVDCGCFGGGEGPITALTVLRNLGLFAAGLAVAVFGGLRR